MMTKLQLFLMAALVVLSSVSLQADIVKTQTFDSAPYSWTQVDTQVGFSNTNYTGGTSGAGEAGGFITGHGTYRRYYADTDLGGSLNLADSLYVSGEFIVTGNGGDHNEQAFIGFFDTTAPTFQNAMGFAILDDSTTTTKQRIGLWFILNDNTEIRSGIYYINHGVPYTFDITWVPATRTATLHLYNSSGTILCTLTKTLTEAEFSNMGSFNTFGISNCKDNTGYGTTEATGVYVYIDNISYTTTYNEYSARNPNPADDVMWVNPTVVTSLIWNSPITAGTYKYDVYRGSSPDSLVLVSSNQSGTSYNLPSALSYATTYYWRVATKNSAGNLLEDGVLWQLTTGGGVLNPSPADGGNDVGCNTVHLTWDSSLASSYDIYMGNSPESLNFVAHTMAKEFLADINQNTLYYWRVDTKDASNILLVTGSVWQFTTGTCEILYNGIVLPAQWPPDYSRDPYEPMPVPYLDSPPSVIPIDVGRQLFVDDFLIQGTTLSRTYHTPEHYPGNPIIKPDESWEFLNGGSEAAPYSGGAWFDPADNLFKMWYTGGYLSATCYATSTDGINWDKPDLNIEAGTNVVLRPESFDSTTIWLDQQDSNPQARFKYFGTERPAGTWLITYRTSADGLHWTNRLVSNTVSGDRSTVFYNPFRNVWVHSEKFSWGSGRARCYSENADPAGLIAMSTSVKWIAADNLDPHNPVAEFSSIVPQLYNLDAAPYESLMLGFFNIWQGPDNSYCAANDLQKRNDILIGYSRDGFHWYRPDRNRFISCTWDVDDWHFGNVQSTGGGCLVVGDKMYFYFSGRAKPDAGFYAPYPGWDEFWAGAAATGLAVLRRDGFASMDAGINGGTLTTRPVTFNGRYLFVNVDNPNGTLQVEILDTNNEVIEPFTKENCAPVSVDKTLQLIRWVGASDLYSLAGEEIRFKFYLTNGSLYSFWVSPDRFGTSRGYVAGGGPGFDGPTDTMPVLTGDINNDGVVNLEDFVIMAANWLTDAR